VIDSRSPTVIDAVEDFAQQEYALCRSVYAESPVLWLAIYHHVGAKGEQLDFANRPWLIQLYRDKSSYIVVKKAAQVGVTTWALCTMFAEAMQGHPGIYIMPTDRIVYEFTPRRIDRVIERVPLYAGHCAHGRKHSNTKTQKTLFGTDWSIVGSNVVTNFFERPVDVLIYDELDKCHQHNLEYAIDRIGASTNPVIRKLSTPTVERFGIDDEYDKSDQKIWMLKCSHCNHWQELDWFRNIVDVQKDDHRPQPYHTGRDGTIRAVCAKCHKVLDGTTKGRWVAKYPDRSISGYHISKLFADVRPTKVLNDLYDRFISAQGNPTKEQRFYNSDLGLPYTAKGSKITDNLLMSCVDLDYAELPMKAENTVCGVDIGNQLHVHISRIENGKRRKVFIGVVTDYNELHNLAVRYGVRLGVMDAGPEIHEPRRFVRSHPGWYLCRYNKDDRVGGTGYDDIKVDHVARSISANRTETLDASFQDYLDRRVILPKNYRSIDNGDFAKQMTIPTRIKQERPDGTFRHIWTKGEDHHRHADNYEAIAARLYAGHSGFITVVEVNRPGG
jgi:hypothetical protein